MQQPDSNIMPEVKEIEIPETSNMGVSVEGSELWFPNADTLTLPEFDKFNQQSYYIEIFNRGSNPFDYSVETKNDWMEISESEGIIESQKRIWVNILWDKIPSGNVSSELIVKGSEGSKVFINILVNNPTSPERESLDGFVESNGYISIEAENFSNINTSNRIMWQIIPNLGRTSSAITPLHVNAIARKVENNTPCLEYKVYLFTTGEISVNAYLSPTLNFMNKPEGIFYAISFDDQPPQIITMTNNPNPPDLNHDPVWNRWVADNIYISISKHQIDKPGEHVLKFWMVDPGVVLQKLVIDTGGLKSSCLGPPESFKYLKY